MAPGPLMRTVSFVVPGIPAAQGSKRHVGRGILVESSKQLGPWRSTVALAAQDAYHRRFLEAGLIDHPVRVDLVFTFPRPKKHYRANGTLRDDAPAAHFSRPDVDKLARAVLDAITGVIIADDSRVWALHAEKVYGPTPGCLVMVRPAGWVLKAA